MSDMNIQTLLPSWMDGLLQDTWLQVVSLRHGPGFREGDGRQFWARCVADIEKVQQSLHRAGICEASRRLILTAQCALIDEAVRRCGGQDDACTQWYNLPLQRHFLGTRTAGDTLCQHMRTALSDPAADMAVLICFHRVMLLGFLGTYRSLHEPDREALIKALGERVPPFRLAQGPSILANVQVPGHGGKMRWTWSIGIAVASLIGLFGGWK